MNSQEQAEGEKRVMQLLVEPLLRRGLAKPTSQNAAKFDEMVQDMCARLAYMTESSLMALEDQVAANPAGKDRDRFPISNVILQWAAEIQPPGDGASPLLRAVFAHACGKTAIAEGWAPELLAEVRKNRRWPGAWTLKTAREGAANALRRMRDLDDRLAREGELPTSDREWRDRRTAVSQRCDEIGGMA